VQVKTQAETGKTAAEVTSVGAGTAAVQVDTAMDMLREMRTDMTAMRGKLESLEGWKATHERLLDAHARWDEQVFGVLTARDIAIDPPPPLRAS
jgi:cytosine/adenosine deaminase-related metal-dependent hydrolase